MRIASYARIKQHPLGGSLLLHNRFLMLLLQWVLAYLDFHPMAMIFTRFHTFFAHFCCIFSLLG